MVSTQHTGPFVLIQNIDKIQEYRQPRASNQYLPPPPPEDLTPPIEPLPTTHTAVHKTIVKNIKIPYPVNKFVTVDRPIPVPITRYYSVNKPYEVIKYVDKPYIVKVERKVPYQVIKKIPVPQPVVKVESVIAEPQHISADQLHSVHPEYNDHTSENVYHDNNSQIISHHAKHTHQFSHPNHFLPTPSPYHPHLHQRPLPPIAHGQHTQHTQLRHSRHESFQRLPRYRRQPATTH